MNIPAFSLFSAVSELFVTAGVLYSLLVNLRGRELPFRVMAPTLAFEFLINITYMTMRASQADKDVALSTVMKIFYATHGILSLLMFLLLAATFLISMVDLSANRASWYARHRGLSWTLIFFWMVSVSTGEAIFVGRYLLP
ncbi:MAG: hypothetical protein HY791_35675 [Deltaproteobacteria bacterium]|nr:hypothetical protein [Deltaproteobacteria bacterium]